MTNNHSIITDDYVAGVLARDAADASLKYSTMGLEAYRAKPANKLKPNTNFLRRLVGETKSHNEALLAKEAAESQARLDEMAREEERKRRKFKPNAKDMRSRQLGDIGAILAGRLKPKRDERDSKSRARKASDSRQIASDPISAPRIRGRGGQKDSSAHDEFRLSRSPERKRRRDDDDRREEDRSRKRRRAQSSADDDRREERRPRRCRSPSMSTSEEEERRDRRSRRNRSRSCSMSRDKDRRHRRSHKRRDQSRSRSPEKRSRSHRQRSPLNGDRLRRSEPSKTSHRRRSKERQISTPPKSQTTGRSDFDTAESDSDPLEDFIGPAPPPPPPTVRVRGRGAVSSSSGIDGRFGRDYDASLDGEPEITNKGSDDWEDEVEAYRDRQRWKQQGAARLREAGFTDDQVKKWEKGGEKDIDDVQWSKKGEKREWDRGKMVGADGAITAKAEWAQ